MSYNNTLHGTLVGNWVEERALKDATGTYRLPEGGASTRLAVTGGRVTAHLDAQVSRTLATVALSGYGRIGPQNIC